MWIHRFNVNWPRGIVLSLHDVSSLLCIMWIKQEFLFLTTKYPVCCTQNIYIYIYIQCVYKKEQKGKKGKTNDQSIVYDWYDMQNYWLFVFVKCIQRVRGITIQSTDHPILYSFYQNREKWLKWHSLKSKNTKIPLMNNTFNN